MVFTRKQRAAAMRNLKKAHAKTKHHHRKRNPLLLGKAAAILAKKGGIARVLRVVAVR